jgi:hypothetical protein
VSRVSGNYVTCSVGQTTCSGGYWGACIGDRIATRQINVGGDLRILGLAGDAEPCQDLCDPACVEFADDAGGLDAAGFTENDAGLTPLPYIAEDSGVLCTGLAVNPPTSTVTVTSFAPLTTVPAMPLLTASYTPATCYAGLANAAWSLDHQDLAVISGGALTLVSGVAGPINVTAFAGGFQATGVVNVVTNVVDISSAPPGAAAQFMGTPTGPDNIKILYPYALTVFPRSIGAPLVQWDNLGVGASAVKVSLQYPATGQPIFTMAGIIAESSPPQFQVNQTGWGYLDQTAAGQDVLLSIQRVVGGNLLSPVTETIHFAPQPLRGNIFYTEYDVRANTAGIKSLRPYGTTPAQLALGGGTCPVCHSVAANGSTLITSNWGGSSSDTTIAAVNANGSLTPIGNMWNNKQGVDSRGFAYSAITPDGQYALQGTNFWGNTLATNQKGAGSTWGPHNNGSGLTGLYYPNTALTAPAVLTRNDGTVDFTWYAGSPGAGITSGTTYSVMWTGQVQPVYSETYTFETESSDGVQLTVNGQQIINQWQTQVDTKVTGTIALTAGTKVPIVLKYENLSGMAQVHLRWSSASQPYEIIPVTQLYPTNVPTAANGLLATYYSNIDFTGTPVSRIDANVNFNWNGNSPATGIGTGKWSAEWTGQVNVPCAGTYQWCVQGDDGVRLWIDGNLMDDGWRDQGATLYCANQAETAGLHDVKMDYYQDGGGSSAEFAWSASCMGGGTATAVPTANLFPTGDQGTGGYNMRWLGPGDYGTGLGYSILSLSPLSLSPLANAPPPPIPVDVTGPNSWGLGTTAMMVPSFSPDATKLVFVDGDTSGGASWRQGLSFFTFNEGMNQFSGRTNVVNTVAAGNIIRWPTFESDSNSVIYQTNPTSKDDTGYGGMGPTGYSTINGQLWSVDVTQAAPTPTPLTVLNAGLGGSDTNLSYQPTVLPVSVGGYRWAVFTSIRQYGNTLNDPPGLVMGGTEPSSQLWVSALDDTASAGTDRSHPPFWLPNQVVSDSGGRMRNERGYWVLDACRPSIANLNPPMSATPPAFTPTDQDIGGPAQAGSSMQASGTYTIIASGSDIWNSSDQFHYVYMPVTGDFIFQARVDSLIWQDNWTKAGVMLRDTLNANAANAYMMINPGGLTQLQWRSGTGNGSGSTYGPQAVFPYWVRLVRSGALVTGYASPDGVNWSPVGSQFPNIGSSAYIGLAVTSHNNNTGKTTTAVFDNVGFVTPGPTDPRPASLCLDDQDCCGALTNPPTASCKVDTPVTSPVTRHCIPLASNSCVALGGMCTSDTDCCGFPNNHCAMGTCQQEVLYSDTVYTRDYVASCPAPDGGMSTMQPVWRFFDWQTITPGNSSIVFSAATATSAASLPTSMGAPSVVPLGTASGMPITVWTGTDVGAALKATGQSPSESYLRVFIDFRPTSDRAQAPTLTAWRQQYDCVAAE